MKRITSLILVGIIVSTGLLSLNCLISDTVEAADWNSETVDSTGDVGELTSMALDSNGHPHISYIDYTNSALKYAKWTGSSWSIETVDSGSKVDSGALAIDSSGKPHIGYYDWQNDDLKYAKWTGSSWSIETVDSAGDVGRFASIAIDNDNRPHICYFDYTNDKVKYAKWTGSSWSKENVGSLGASSWHTTIAVDNNGYPHIGYYSDGLKYAKWTGGSWSTETIDDNGGAYPSLVLDRNGHPHISYVDGIVLTYAKWTGSDWYIDVVHTQGDVSDYNSLALDINGCPHISYYDLNQKDLKYAWWTGSRWVFRTLDSAGEVGNYNSIALDSNGYTHVSYFDKTNYDLKYVKGVPPTAPSPPQNFQAAIGNEFINLTWDAPLDDGGSTITKYRIYRDDKITSYEIVPGDQLWYNDTGLVNGITHVYSVTAENDIGESVATANISAIPATVPSEIDDLEATAGDGYVNLTWTEAWYGGSPITNYRIYRGTESGKETLHVESGNFTWYNDTDVTNGQIYYYMVGAVNSIGENLTGVEVSAMPRGNDTDTDNDGLPDLWEIEHFGDINIRPEDDSDADGFTNMEEYLENTNPTDENDYPIVENPFLQYWWAFVIILVVIVGAIVAFMLRKKPPKISEEIPPEPIPPESVEVEVGETREKLPPPPPPSP